MGYLWHSFPPKTYKQIKRLYQLLVRSSLFFRIVAEGVTGQEVAHERERNLN